MPRFAQHLPLAITFRAVGAPEVATSKLISPMPMTNGKWSRSSRPQRATLARHINWTKLTNCRTSVIKAALHFPASNIELAAGSAIEAGPVCLALVRKRPAHLSMPTAEQPGNQAAESTPRWISKSG